MTCCSQGLSESPDLEFEYADTDKWAAELSGVCVLIMDIKISPTTFCQSLSHLSCSDYLFIACFDVSELYSYTEGPEFALNRKCFEVEFRTHGA